MSAHRVSLGVVLVLLALGLCSGPVNGTDITSAGSGYWTNPAAWTPAQVPAGGDAVTILDGHTNTISDAIPHDVGSLTIASNGVLTHTMNSTDAAGERYKVALNVAGNLTIDAGGQINADAKGYVGVNGPGKPSGSGGAGYGGASSKSGSYGGGTTYGSITAPTNIGSGTTGAGGGNPNLGGGGAILLTVAGTAAVNGLVSATGATNPVGCYYGASGGSVFLTTGALTGNGTIRANGGGPAVQCSGGGGRVAVILTNSADFGAVTMQAYAGTPGAEGNPGAGGTVYLQTTNHAPGQGKLVVDYNNILPIYTAQGVTTIQNGVAASSNAFSEIILTNGAVYGLDTNDTLDITGTTIGGGIATNRNTGIWVNGGTLAAPASFGFTNYFIALGTNAAFNPAASLTIGTNATLTILAPQTLNYSVTVASGGALTINASCALSNSLTMATNGVATIDAPFMVNGSVTVQPGGNLTHSANTASETYRMNMSVYGNLDVQTGGRSMRTLRGMPTTRGLVRLQGSLGEVTAAWVEVLGREQAGTRDREQPMARSRRRRISGVEDLPGTSLHPEVALFEWL